MWHPRLTVLFACVLLASGCGGVSQPSESLTAAMPVAGREAVIGRPPVEYDAIEIEWRIDPFVSTFWIVDQLSRWSGRLAAPGYYSAFEAHAGLDANDRAVLDAYARVRRAHSGLGGGEGPQAMQALDLLGGPLPHEHFPRVFLTSSSVDEAARRLLLNLEERNAVQTAFRHFEPRIKRLLERADHLEQARRDMQTMAHEVALGRFIGQIAHFLGVEEQLDEGAITVHLIWAPDGHSRATLVGSNMLIPLAASVATQKARLAMWLGVVVHEITHYLLSRLSEQRRIDVTHRILAEVGIPNARRANVVDEALATAMGNIIFMRRYLGEHFDPTLFYSFEPDYEYPYAIDSLARALAPHIERQLEHGGRFDSAFVEELLQIHREVFTPMPRHHTRVALVFAESAQLSSYFAGVFPGVSQWHRVGDERAFATDSHRHRMYTRWVLATTGYIEGNPERVNDLEVPFLTRLARLVSESGAQAACLQVYRRGARGPYDFVAIGANADALRRLLIAAHTHIGIPLEQPLCTQ